MALRRALWKPRLFSSPPKTNFLREYVTSSRRFLHRRALSHRPVMIPEFLSLSLAGDNLRDKLRSINITPDTLRPTNILPPHQSGLSVHDTKKLLRLAQVEKLKATLRDIPDTTIPYSRFLNICSGVCADEDQGLHFAKMLDDSGNVIVLGSLVFLRPDQVAKSMESIISETIALPGDPRRREVEEMEKEKAAIDEKARGQVRAELYCGLGFMAVQTLGFMRLTFWELSWDVMEPICFFVASLHFAGAYTFFLRTSTEPTFEGYFQRRFKTKQRRLMEANSFDMEKYDRLRRACGALPSPHRFHGCSSFGSRPGALAGAMDR